MDVPFCRELLLRLGFRAPELDELRELDRDRLLPARDRLLPDRDPPLLERDRLLVDRDPLLPEREPLERVLRELELRELEVFVWAISASLLRRRLAVPNPSRITTTPHIAAESNARRDAARPLARREVGRGGHVGPARRAGQRRRARARRPRAALRARGGLARGWSGSRPNREWLQGRRRKRSQTRAAPRTATSRRHLRSASSATRPSRTRTSPAPPPMHLSASGSRRTTPTRLLQPASGSA